MIGLYEIGRNENGHPYLIAKKEFSIDKRKLTEDNELISLFRNGLDLDKYINEHMYLVAYDYYKEALGIYLVAIGTYKECSLYKRNIIEALMVLGARKFIMVHNHPEGSLLFSKEDREIQKSIKKATDELDIEFMGNYVITRDGIVESHGEPIYFKDEEV